MKKHIKQILKEFSNAYGGDIMINENNQYLHLSYDEVKKLLKKIRKRDQFVLKRNYTDFIIEKISKFDENNETHRYLSAEELLILLRMARRPKEVHPRTIKYKIRLPKETQAAKKDKKPKSVIKKADQQEARFDWHDHYLEGLRIHGNKDDAEAHADEMKRTLTGRR